MALNRHARGPRPAGPVRKTVEVVISGAIGMGIVLLIVLLLRGSPGGSAPDGGQTAQPVTPASGSPSHSSRTLSPAPVGYPASSGDVRTTPCGTPPCQSSAPAGPSSAPAGGGAPSPSNTPTPGVSSTTPASTPPGLVGGAVGGVTGAVGGVAGAVGGLVGGLVGGVADGN